MNIYLCDDNFNFLEIINKKILQICNHRNIECEIQKFILQEEMLNCIKNIEKDIIPVCFVDIDMPQINGFDLAKRLQQMNDNLIIVFVSNREDLVFESFAYHPFFFIRKNHLHDELEQQIVEIDKVVNPKHILVQLNDGKNNINIFVDEVEYIESDKNYVHIFINNNKLKIRQTIKKLESQWKAHGFIRVHNGYLVNYRYIKEVTAKNIILKSMKEVPITRGKMSEIKYLIMEAVINE